MWIDTINRDGFYGVVGPATGLWVPIVQASALHQGWVATSVFLVSDDLSIMELKNGPERASWILDGDFKPLGDARDVVPHEIFRKHRERFAPLLLAIRESVLSNNTALNQSAELDNFFRLCQQTRATLGEHCLTTVPTKIITIASRKIRELPHLERTLQTTLVEGFRAGADRKCLCFIDPETGGEVFVHKSIPLTRSRFALPFTSSIGKSYFLCAVDHVHLGKILGLYDVAANTLYVTSQAESLSKETFPNVVYDINVVAAELGDVLVPYLHSGKTQFATYLRPSAANHMGHQLWNELSGLQSILKACKQCHLPHVIVPEASDGTEMFGPVEEIFPEFDGKVHRYFEKGDFRRRALEDGFTLLRFSDEYVSHELRTRLSVRAVSGTHVDADKAKYEIFSKRGAPIFLLGLRVENRTLVDLHKFCDDFLQLCIECYPGCAIVVDGHNSRNAYGEMIHSHGQWAAKRAPVTVEKEIVASLRDKSKNSTVSIIDNIGRPVDYSIFWSLKSDAFVTIWGAGLAKYRWIANLPGLVITSRWNIENRPDLHIYSASQYLEKPEAMEFINPALVEDDLTSEPLMKFATDQSQESYANFRIVGGLAFLKNYLDGIVRTKRN